MARGELIRKLIVSHRRGSEEDFRAAALQIIAEEERKNNHQLARDLLKILEDSDSQPPHPSVGLGTLPKDRERQTLLVELRYPERRLSEIILHPENKRVIERALEEINSTEILRTHGLKSQSKFLFCGPPGCGKTMCAEIMSSELGLPLLYTRFDSIVSSYLGETAANLRRIFDYARGGRWLVLFDEFDAIGKMRDDPHELGELKRVVNSFLQLLDSFVDGSILIAATNHAKLLDPALWRRFDEIVYFPKPTVNDIRKLLDLKFRNFEHKVDLESRSMLMKGMSHSDVERVSLDAIKSAVLEGIPTVNAAQFDAALKRQKERMQISRLSRAKSEG